MEKYIIKRGNIYCYRRRVPKNIERLLHQSVYTKSLSKSLSESNRLAGVISGVFSKALLQIQLGQIPDIAELSVSEYKVPFIQSSIPKFSQVAKEYIGTLSVKNTRLKAYQSIIDTASIIIRDQVSHASLDKLKNVLEGMPKRNIQRYKIMSVQEMMKLKVPEEERVFSSNVKEYLVLINSVLKFGYDRGYYDRLYRAKITKITKNVRAERKALDKDRIMWLINGAKKQEVVDAYRILYLSGMRLSELFKCTISMVEGVKCFDLTDKTVELKTASSHRVIPIHSSLADNIEEMLARIQKINMKYLSNVTNNCLEEGESLYSLRHSFATHIIAAGVRSEILSELMGHTHKSMSLNRYTKGFPIQMLQDAINRL